jgi:hypothetical protein
VEGTQHPDRNAQFEHINARAEKCIERGTPVEALEKLVALHERVADRLAASEFADAMARFQARCPSIPKQSRAKITTKSGQQYQYTYAELDTIAQTIRPILHELGLSYTWDSHVVERTLECVCTLRHVNGHTVQATFSCSIDTASAMNEQQKVAASLTYARRQSLIQVLGLTTTDPDTDAQPDATIGESQQADLRALVLETAANEVKFLAFMGVESYAEIRAADYARAVAALEARRRKR